MLKEKTLHKSTFRYRRYGGGEDGNSWGDVFDPRQI
jgi:hypothetical protein